MDTVMIKKHLIIGSSSGIATSIIQSLSRNNGENLILISRHFDKIQSNLIHHAHLIHIKRYEEDDIHHVCKQLTPLILSEVESIFICNGILHSPEFLPEKQLESFSSKQFNDTMMANALSAILWIQGLVNKLNYKPCCKIIVFSARIGSISDNQLGGWYSYRASKAALNMLLKTAAIECRRRHKHIKIIAFHPGTTDTQLSKPYQKNVAKNKLFSTTFVAKQLLDIIEVYQADGELSFIDWQNKKIAF
jgi:NAD(P)-dependent dehydrogenase (short-subunit alcohol dehydrogenase family)